MTKPRLRVAGIDDMERVLDLVGRYHAFDEVSPHYGDAETVIEPLLGEGDAGRIWLVELGGRVIGYAVLCFGYSIEFGGRDAFVDEMYILEEHRGKGFGAAVLEMLRSAARELDVKALHLEVAHGNERARRLYGRAGFTSRDRYRLMTLVL